MKNAAGDDYATRTRLLVCVLREVLDGRTFETIGDVKEALKVRAARLGIAYDSGLIAVALDRFEEGGRRPIIRRAAAARAAHLVEADPDPEVITRAEAVRIMAELFG